MFNFSDLNITTKENTFTGKKIDVEDVLNEEIVIHDFDIGDSKFFEGTKCLKLQIEIENKKRVVFTSGKTLMAQINEVPEDKFPFKTTIKKNDKRLEFT